MTKFNKARMLALSTWVNKIKKIDSQEWRTVLGWRVVRYLHPDDFSELRSKYPGFPL